MIDVLIRHYQESGGVYDLNQLAGSNPDMTGAASQHPEDYREMELRNFGRFSQLIGSRAVILSVNHHVVARTRRWIQHINTFEPVSLEREGIDSGLRAIPFTESPAFDTFSPDVTFNDDTLPHAFGFFFSALPVKKILSHAVVSRPWIRPASRRIGIAKRFHPHSTAAPTHEHSPRDYSRQQAFSLLLKEVIELDDQPNTGS
jgi:hypothetical protein